jgi:hypothetical protein
MTKTRHKKTYKRKLNKTYKRIPNRNSYYVNEINKHNLPKHLDNSVSVSYSPTINKDLVKLQSVKRENIHNCNNDKAFKLQESLQVGIPGKFFGKTCVPYYDPKAVSFLLKNLSANKHINPDEIVTPVQSHSNCWFNTMFVSLFVSDKGRKFFHFFRQLMIEGIQSNGHSIPNKLRDGFALLNYAIDACLTGNKYAYILDTNAIIKKIYEAIPETYKEKLPYIKNIDESGNPMRYYGSLIYYLDNKSIQLMFIKDATNKWKEMILKDLQKVVPHFIILEIYDGKNETAGKSGEVTNKPKSFTIKGYKYILDSCIIRDTSQQHFCATITCNSKEMAYDGMSYHRLVNLDWKNHINSDFMWSFEGSNNSDGSPLKWSFLHGYQMLLYYRVR